MTADAGPESFTPREAVIEYVKDAENVALRRHTAIPGGDGMGSIRILCGCDIGFSPEAWASHLRSVRDYARKPKPKR